MKKLGLMVGTVVLTAILFVGINGCTVSEDAVVDPTFTFNTVTNPKTGRIWMDRNLGATRVATRSTDVESYGDLYQWGRRADGHQLRNSAIISTKSNVDQPAHGGFIPNNFGDGDWRSPQNTSLWQGVNGVNNPCPTGYRIPTEAEWEAEIASWSANSSIGAFASPLKLPVAGARDNGDDAILLNVGTVGYYWSSTISGVKSRAAIFSSSNATRNTGSRAGGTSIRCIKN